MKQFGVAIIAYKRPSTLGKVVEAIAGQLPDGDIHLFIDGPNINDSYPIEIVEGLRRIQADIFHHYIPGGHVHDVVVNIGTGRMWRLAFDQMFESYHRLLFLEDDCVVQPYYVSQIKVLLDMFSTDERVGFVSAYGDSILNHADQEASMAELRPMAHMWGVATWKGRYQQLKPILDEYYALDGFPAKVEKWYEGYGTTERGTSQDIAFAFASASVGQVRIATVTNNLINIGVDGECTSPGLYVRHFMGRDAFNKPYTDFKYDESLFETCRNDIEHYFYGNRA